MTNSNNTNPLERVAREELKCPHCSCRTFACVDEATLDGGWDNTATIRCVECKRTYANPHHRELCNRVSDLLNSLHRAEEERDEKAAQLSSVHEEYAVCRRCLSDRTNDLIAAEEREERLRGALEEARSCIALSIGDKNGVLGRIEAALTHNLGSGEEGETGHAFPELPSGLDATRHSSGLGSELSTAWRPVGFILEGEDWEPGDIGVLLNGPVGYGYTICDLQKFAAARDTYDALRGLLSDIGQGADPADAECRARTGSWDKAQAAIALAEGRS